MHFFYYAENKTQFYFPSFPFEAVDVGIFPLPYLPSTSEIRCMKQIF